RRLLERAKPLRRGRCRSKHLLFSRIRLQHNFKVPRGLRRDSDHKARTELSFYRNDSRSGKPADREQRLSTSKDVVLDTRAWKRREDRVRAALRRRERSRFCRRADRLALERIAGHAVRRPLPHKRAIAFV